MFLDLSTYGQYNTLLTYNDDAGKDFPGFASRLVRA